MQMRRATCAGTRTQTHALSGVWDEGTHQHPQGFQVPLFRCKEHGRLQLLVCAVHVHPHAHQLSHLRNTGENAAGERVVRCWAGAVTERVCRVRQWGRPVPSGCCQELLHAAAAGPCRHSASPSAQGCMPRRRAAAADRGQPRPVLVYRQQAPRRRGPQPPLPRCAHSCRVAAGLLGWRRLRAPCALCNWTRPRRRRRAQRRCPTGPATPPTRARADASSRSCAPRVTAPLVLPGLP